MPSMHLPRNAAAADGGTAIAVALLNAFISFTSAVHGTRTLSSARVRVREVSERALKPNSSGFATPAGAESRPAMMDARTPAGWAPPSRARAYVREAGIVLKAAEKVFAETGFGDTGMDATAMLAGVSEPALYSNLKGKQDLLAAAMRKRCAGVLPDPVGGEDVGGRRPRRVGGQAKNDSKAIFNLTFKALESYLPRRRRRPWRPALARLS